MAARAAPTAPTAAEVFLSKRLEIQLRDMGVYESDTGLKHRKRVLATINNAVQAFCHDVRKRQGVYVPDTTLPIAKV